MNLFPFIIAGVIAWLAALLLLIFLPGIIATIALALSTLCATIVVATIAMRIHAINKQEAFQ